MSQQLLKAEKRISGLEKSLQTDKFHTAVIGGVSQREVHYFIFSLKLQ